MHPDSSGAHGSPRIHAVLRRAGQPVGRNRVETGMRRAGLRGLAALPRRTRTTDSGHSYPIAPNRLAPHSRHTGPTRPGSPISLISLSGKVGLPYRNPVSRCARHAGNNGEGDRDPRIHGRHGGTEALKVLLEALPAENPGMVIVQHMPELFSKSFADRPDSLCSITANEAQSNDTVIRGRILIAPGNHHLVLVHLAFRHAGQKENGTVWIE